MPLHSTLVRPSLMCRVHSRHNTVNWNGSRRESQADKELINDPISEISKEKRSGGTRVSRAI